MSSDRAGGTTGAGRCVEIYYADRKLSTAPGLAVVWKITPLFAEWLISENSILSKTSTITANSTVLELGCGVSGILALSISPRVHKYVATDQEYVFKLLKQNLNSNATRSSTPKAKAKPPTKKKAVAQLRETTHASNIEILALDWESSDLSDLPGVLRSSADEKPLVDVVLACDCIYNETLIEPFVRTCAELCRLPDSNDTNSFQQKPTICVIAQQLRSHTVFENWLTVFMATFRVWRVPDMLLTEGLRSGNGFIVHVGLLKGAGEGSTAQRPH